MRKLTLNFLFAFVILGLLGSCDQQQNPFGGPQYDFEGNLAIDREKIDTYLETAQIDSLYRIHDPSGVVIIVQEEGEGARPNPGNFVYCNYTGALLDGTVFDTNIREVAEDNDLNTDRPFNVFQFVVFSQAGPSAIEGFNHGFSRLRSGSKAVLLIPSPLAYRDTESNPLIPPNSVLVFDVDFLGLD
ncbi:FKBP-type peptidyl-prolyl cis-trans isomerase [Pararhodonellum marinum]|uniref:FKBP-type peptidyl-prolyl cis-trans isomerase n=1 Tax=Pararhodonellum marinum TaxID=2755358 RepID=UPI00188F98BF|nr:FKBP-type peptidyl-prolyl cis-trans isomerase [Pararhodonellum marinum]